MIRGLRVWVRKQEQHRHQRSFLSDMGASSSKSNGPKSLTSKHIRKAIRNKQLAPVTVGQDEDPSGTLDACESGCPRSWRMMPSATHDCCAPCCMLATVVSVIQQRNC